MNVDEARAIVRFDAKKVDVSKIVEKIDASRFSASLETPVTTVVKNTEVEWRVTLKAIAYKPGAEAAVVVEVIPAKGVRLADLFVEHEVVGAQGSAAKGSAAKGSAGGKVGHTGKGVVKENRKFPIGFQTPAKVGDAIPRLALKLGYRLEKKGEGVGERTELTLDVPIPVEA